MGHLSASPQGVGPRHALRHCSSKHSSPRPVLSRPVRRCRVLASSTATLEQAPAAAAVPPSAAGAVISQLVGKKVVQLSDSHSAVPLLHPIAHSLPFSASLHIYSQHSSTAKPPSNPKVGRGQSGTDAQADGTLVGLHYVISGQGYFSNAATDVQQPLSPGDSIISLHGAATFTAGPLPQQQQQQQEEADTQQQQQQASSTPSWSQLLGWLQQSHAKQQQHATPSPPHTANTHASQPQAAAGAAAAAAAPAAQASSSSSQLVMLQLLLPSELLTGQMLTHHPGHCHAVAQQLPWAESASSLNPNAAAAAAAGSEGLEQGSLCDVTHTGSIHAGQVCGLLVDAGLSPPASETQQQQQQQQGEGLFLHASTQEGPPTQQQQQQEVVAAADGSNSGKASPAARASSQGVEAAGPVTSDHGRNESATDDTSSSSGSSHVLPSLNQQQILKRALSDVGAFRLPHQTNRLALLFGPHSAPAVCCSFGVEVFEPGHVTPLHIHNTAHELFFVLAGKGEAVFRAAADAADADEINPSSSSSSSAQRVLMSPGDVAVFPPGVVHGVDNPGGSQLYCLQMMLPNEYFVEWVRSGEEAGQLDVGAVQRLAAAASCG